METSTEEEKTVESIEIKDDEMRPEDESDSESVVEVVEPEDAPEEPLEVSMAFEIFTYNSFNF